MTMIRRVIINDNRYLIIKFSITNFCCFNEVNVLFATIFNANSDSDNAKEIIYFFGRRLIN